MINDYKSVSVCLSVFGVVLIQIVIFCKKNMLRLIK